MYLCIAYDISSTRTRTRAARYCKRIGMMRLQKSVFIGQVQESQKNELETTILPLLATSDKWAVIPMTKEIWVHTIKNGNDNKILPLLNRVNVWTL